MGFLTDRTLATGVTLQDLIHIVITGDTSQGNFAGSSYKATIGQVFDSISGYCIPDLYVTNVYGCSPITVHDELELVTGIIRTSGGTGAELNLKDPFGPNGTWSITSDNGGYTSGSSWIFGQPNNGTQIAYQINTYPGEAIGITVLPNFAVDTIYTGKEILIGDNISNNKSSGSPNRRAVFIGSKNSTINSGVVNTVVIGGSNIVATDSNKVYVSALNIDNIGGGTPSINLGLDINGNVVTGTTTPPVVIYTTTGITTSQTITWDKTYWGISGTTNVDITLPSTTSKDGYILIIKDEAGIAGSNRIRLIPTTETIDGNPFVDMNINYMSLTIMARNNNWWII